MTILLTGHRGFIGSHLYRALDGLGEQIVGYDVPECDYDNSLTKLFKVFDRQITAIFHLGAITDTGCTDAAALEETNVRLTVRLGMFAESRRIPFIYASSAAVYGNGSGPLNSYALAKLSADEIMEARVGGQWWGLRFFNVYGPGEESKGHSKSMVSKAVEAYYDGRAAEFYDLSARRDFVHVRDAVNTMVWVWKQQPKSGVYDVGTGHARSIAEMCAIVQECMGIEQPPVEISVPPFLKGLLQTNTKADMHPLYLQNYQARFLSLEEGVAKTLAMQGVVAG